MKLISVTQGQIEYFSGHEKKCIGLFGVDSDGNLYFSKPFYSSGLEEIAIEWKKVEQKSGE